MDPGFGTLSARLLMTQVQVLRWVIVKRFLVSALCSRSLLLQVMGRAVAIATFRELLQHTSWVRFAVARLARRNVLMFLLMTVNARKVVVFRSIRLKQRHGLAVTRTAVMRRGRIRVGDHQRHMNRMACFTGLKIHVFSMFLMAFHALGDQPVG